MCGPKGYGLFNQFWSETGYQYRFGLFYSAHAGHGFPTGLIWGTGLKKKGIFKGLGLTRASLP